MLGPRCRRDAATLRGAVVDRGDARRVVLAALPPRPARERRQGRRRGARCSIARCATGPQRSTAPTRLRLLSSRSALVVLHREVARAVARTPTGGRRAMRVVQHAVRAIVPLPPGTLRTTP